ncbi:hypothetical protein FOXB_04694 [Fusarium oxysporum f. sp. conglutinans Fo5176]|uniref:non-specific serine/threonine protein kinase n=1 Tax=Fusarium oxysporum (strain Fo5176) TaxID=660025 RepID=F9FE66_FUSOF|nr:hypothetical protein FOXB_04694 [Fusarium oxysporum f. sp. conglutinans Fo5176]
MMDIDSHHSGTQRVLKIHRLGRISFRTVKSNRDYLKNRQSGSWMYLSRLAAMKEFAFMKALREEGFPVPEPIAQSRHTIVMSLIDAFPLRQIAEVPDPASLYADLIALILRLAKQGLIHGDFNEFNILIKENVTKSEDGEETLTLEPVIIDFPQMISMEHQNAEMYFDRDVNCIKRFFERRFHFVPTEPGPFFRHAKKTVGKDGVKRLDATVEASGFTKRMLKDLEAAIKEKGDQTAQHSGDEDDEDEDDDNDEDEESENSDADNTEHPHDGQVSGGLLGDDAMASKEDMVEDSMSKLTV